MNEVFFNSQEFLIRAERALQPLINNLNPMKIEYGKDSIIFFVTQPEESRSQWATTAEFISISAGAAVDINGEPCVTFFVEFSDGDPSRGINCLFQKKFSNYTKWKNKKTLAQIEGEMLDFLSHLRISDLNPGGIKSPGYFRD